MKNFTNHIKFIGTLLSILILFQSCRVYHATSVTLKQAVMEEKRVKVRMKNMEKFRFQRIGFESGQFYGVKRIKGKIVRIPLSQEEIGYIKLHNKTWSVIYGIITGVVITYGAAIILFLITWTGPNFSTINFSY